jgi:hypothetical protein
VGSPDVIAVQFAKPEAVYGTDASAQPATTAEAAAATLAANPDFVILGESPSQVGGLEGFTVEIGNEGDANAPVMDVPPGALRIDSGRRLWVSFFDTSDGLLAIMVGGSAEQWEEALTTAEPLLESIVIAD